ncbi:MAG TPA: metal-dependent transcriptional regulator [Calditrichia bacterium]|nr:metal-dependent transcriptional regulator [Calditrichota bacterium]HQU72265.1 metal-dependent transcriptional regulator [Calditrichia bacterium]HQV30725.1 metal-dependent transcriptional regulator [Calditrichia bacterium]
MVEESLEKLLIAVVGLVMLWALFRPVSGFFWRMLRASRQSDRVLIEDGLKHLHDCEYKGLQCTIQSLAGALSINGERAVRLVTRLEALHLVRWDGNLLVLTTLGRSYALRVIRIHRLWERFLADQTGIPEPEWHAAAEKQEHRLSEQEANQLASKMGHPRFDPHGDPIPTLSGELPPMKGKPLSELKTGEFAEIVHIEDEPETVYAQLVAEGLYPGLLIQMLDQSNGKVRFAAQGEEILLAPVLAANITVEPAKRLPETVSGTSLLADLQPGETAEVVNISRACRGLQRQRLMDLGIIPGTVLQVGMRSAAGDPVAYHIRGAVIALRREHTKQINVLRVEENQHESQ